jgi:hypothetical protein
MKDLSILKPVFAQVALTFVLMFWMAKERLDAWRAGTVVRGEPGTRPTWVGRAGYVSNAFHNQLEVPMLFYALVAFALIADAIDSRMIVMAWVYVALRYLQAIIHTTYNYIPHRFFAFLAGCMVLVAMWVMFALRVL